MKEGGREGEIWLKGRKKGKGRGGERPERERENRLTGSTRSNYSIRPNNLVSQPLQQNSCGGKVGHGLVTYLLLIQY